MYHQAAKKSWPIFFWFYPPKKQFFSGGAQISRNGAVQPNFWKSHSANMKPDCRKYLQAIIVAVDKETNLPVFSSTSGEKVWWKHHLCHPKTDFSQLSEVQSENDSGWLCFRAMSLKRTCWQRRRTWWRARRSWTRRVEKVILIWWGRCDDGGRRQERKWEFFKGNCSKFHCAPSRQASQQLDCLKMSLKWKTCHRLLRRSAQN